MILKYINLITVNFNCAGRGGSFGRGGGRGGFNRFQSDEPPEQVNIRILHYYINIINFNFEVFHLFHCHQIFYSCELIVKN